MSDFTNSEINSNFAKSDISQVQSGEIGRLRRPISNLTSTVAPGLKPLRLPRAQLQVICHKRATNYRAVLREMTYKDKASYESSYAQSGEDP